jgi:signal transduction histidine kinase
MSVSPVRNEINLVTTFVAFLHDMTEKLAVESQLHQSQRLESIGHLVAGIAHDLSAPAQAVAANVRFLSDSFDPLLSALRSHPARPGETAGVDLDFVAEAVPRALAEAAKMASQITSTASAMEEFSHPGSSSHEPADINAAIRSTVTICRSRWKDVADLDFDLAEDLPRVPCSIADMNYVFLTLILNAADALAASRGSGRGRIVVATRLVGDLVEISVRDDGPGIPKNLASRIFEPSGKGAGQGLVISRATVVNDHGGTLTFDSLPGVATTFRIRLPLQQQAVARRA